MINSRPAHPREGSYAIFIPTLTAGGAERVASILANEWCGANQVDVVTYFDEPHFFELDPRVRVHRIGMAANRNAVGRVIDVARAALALRRIVGRIRPTFVLSFMNKYNAFCLASLAGLRIPVIVSERGSPTERLPKVREFARDKMYALAAGLICQTTAGREFMAQRISISHVAVIPNPTLRILDPQERAPEKIVLSVGRFVEAKATDQLIAAFADMKTPGWRLVLCGDGPLRPQLETQVARLGLSGRVEFAGAVRDLKPYYRRAGIFAFSSLHEGYPNALAEATVSGLPCVAYDCPTGPADIIVDGVSGLLTPVGDVGALRAGLDLLAGDIKLAEKFAKAAAETAESLAPTRIAGRYLDFCLESADAGIPA